MNREEIESPALPLAIIPARGGSKAIRRKNLIDLGGKPLIAWTIEAALAAGVRPLVSSEDEEILSISAKYGSDVIERPAALAEDSVHAVHAVLDTLVQLERQGKSLDLVLMLLPTSPFRTSDHIAGAVRLFQEKRPPAVISVEELDKQLIHLRRVDEDGALIPFLGWDQLTAQRQEQPPLFGLNGSIYVAQADVLQENRTFHVQGALAFTMPARASIDINEPADLAYARYLLDQVTP